MLPKRLPGVGAVPIAPTLMTLVVLVTLGVPLFSVRLPAPVIAPVVRFPTADRTGVPAVTVIQDPEAEEALKRIADKVGAPLDITGKTIEFSYRFEATRMLGPHNRVCLTTPNSRFEHLAVPLVGEHQAINCGLALSIIDKLKERAAKLWEKRPEEVEFNNGRLSAIGNGVKPMTIKEITPRLARTGGPGRKGVTAFIMETGTPGFTMQPIPVIRPLYPQELFFEDVKVPVENRIGDEGQGFAVVEFCSIEDGGITVVAIFPPRAAANLVWISCAPYGSQYLTADFRARTQPA